MNLTYFQDPGHGWIKAPRTLLEVLKIELKISPYSYQHGDSVYLEEDCDAPVLLDALKREGIKVEITNRHTNGNSRIRSYRGYAPNEQAVSNQG